MSIEFKTLLKKVMILDLSIGIVVCLITTILFSLEIAKIIFIGLATALINFALSGIIFENAVNSKVKRNKILLPIAYIIRIVAVLLIALPFINNFKNILAFFSGFTMHFPILILSWFIIKKGCE